MNTAHDNFGLAREAQAFNRRLALLGASFIGYSPVPLGRDRAALQADAVTSAPGTRHLLRRLLRSGWTRFQHARKRRAAIAELSALSDRTLRDIGIARAEIPAVVAAILRDGQRETPRGQRPVITAVRAVHRQDVAGDASNDPRFDAAA